MLHVATVTQTRGSQLSHENDAAVRKMEMTSKLEALIERARSVHMTAYEKEEQRRSFAYGNTRIENKAITRDTIDVQAELLNAV
jgi:hypothetical protein